MSAIEWHGSKAYATCAACGKLVCLNKGMFSSLHYCATVCERRGHHHSEAGVVRRTGPFWRRRYKIRCDDCGESVTVPRPVTS